MLLHISTLLLIVTCAQCAKILALFPVASPSHFVLGNALVRALAAKGHDVTMVSPFSDDNASYREIILTGIKEEYEKKQRGMQSVSQGSANSFIMSPIISKVLLDLTAEALEHPNVQKLLDSDEEFDAVILTSAQNEAHMGFAKRFNAPLILFTTIGTSAWTNDAVGNPTPLAYFADILLGYYGPLNFCQRLLNFLMYIYVRIISHIYVFPQHDKLLKKYFGQDYELSDLVHNVSLVLLNSHPSMNQPVPYVPNMVDIGGFHIQPPKKLPKDLQEFLDGSPEGVIYFSMGSNVKSVHFPEEKRDAFLKAFGKLKVKVLWKWDGDVLPGQPRNVRLGKWLPQRDILAHPNVKLFITQGGLLSTTETVYHGVPVLVIPIIGDQMLNAERIVQQGFGLRLHYPDITEATLSDAITELLENPKYSENAKLRSGYFHDRIVPPMETAIYWIEYVIRHRGAPHLRVAALDLPWYQYLLLDVILVPVGVALVFLHVGVRLFRKWLKKRAIRKSGTKKVKTS